MYQKYKYYEPVELSEHHYFAEEILEIYSSLLEPNTTASNIHYMIKNYLKATGVSIRTLYYQTSKGLKRVYPVDIALDAITYNISNINSKNKKGR